MRAGKPFTSIAVAGLVLGLQLLPAVPAFGDDAPILVADSDKVTLADVEAGGATASVTLENQGAADVNVAVAPGPGATTACVITPPGDPTIKAHRQQKMSFTFSEACQPHRKEGTRFTITAGASTFDLQADPPKTADPNWVAVGGIFLGAAVLSALVLAASWNRWTPPTSYPGQKKFRMPLPTLDANWKFSDSWAANATVVTAVFTGIFGAKEVTTALLGDGMETLLAVALVSAAAAVGLVGVSPMVLQALRQRFNKKAAHTADGKPLTSDMEAGLYVTPRALIFAALFTLTGTVGQLAALLYALTGTEFGNDVAIGVLGVAAGVLIYWYAYRATGQNLTTGATLSPPEIEATVTVPPTTVPPSPDGPDRAVSPNQAPIVVVVAPQTATVAASQRSAGIL